MTMQAVQLKANGDVDQFTMTNLPIPQPKAGEIRIRIKAAAFNPVDVKIRKGVYGPLAQPTVLGADCSGVVDALGSGVSHFSVGDEVFGMAFGPCSNGSYAQYLCLPAVFACKKPSNLSFEQAASLPVVAMTAYRALVTSGALANKGSIFIAGAGGGVGSIAVQLAQHFHQGPIFTVAGSQKSKEEMVRLQKIPAEQIILYEGLSTKQLKEKLVACNAGKLFSATFDFVGQEMKMLCLELADYSGHVSSIVPEEPEFHAPVWTRGESLCFNKNLHLHLIFVGAEAFAGPVESWVIYQDILLHVAHLLETKALVPPQIHSLGTLSVATVKEAHRLLESNRVKGKLVMSIL